MSYKYRLREDRGDSVLMENGPLWYHTLDGLYRIMYSEYKIWKSEPNFPSHVFYAEEYNELSKSWYYIGQVGRENGLVFLFLHSHKGGYIKHIVR